ncbi:hypothetical protein K439DRAFT_1296740, partial [Ramaria rubella]
KKRKCTLTLNEYVEQALTEREKNDADVALVWYIVYSNSALSCAENPYFQQFPKTLQLSYSPPSRLVI